MEKQYAPVRLLVRALVLDLALALAGLAGLPLRAQGPDCGVGALVNLVGFDTSTGEALFSLSGSGGSSWLVSWKQGAASARLYREPEDAGRFGGSVGPGSVFVFKRCGAGCLQAMRFDAGAWKPLGEPIVAPSTSTVHATYDLSGRPWAVIQSSSERRGFTHSWAFHLDGREWRAAGELDVTAVAVPGAAPAPWYDRAIVTGTGLFSADASPRSWLSGLPADRSGPGAQVVAFDRRAGAFVSPEGTVYRTADGGKSWSLSNWTPWGTGSAEPWRRGTDFSLDLPTGIPNGVLPVIWFDRRIQGKESVIFSEMTNGGRWRELASGPADIPTSAGRDVSVLLVLRTVPDRWSMIYGCVRAEGDPRLVVVEIDGKRIGAPKLVPVVAAESRK
jgi:hypothetical protein